MTRLLLLITDLKPGAEARQAYLLARHLPAESIRLGVAVLGPSTPWVESLRQEGLRVETLDWRRPFDIAPFRALRRLLQEFQPEVIHVCDSQALRALTLAQGPRPARLFLSGQLPPHGKPAAIDRWLWPRWARFLAQTRAEGQLHERAGIAAGHIDVVAPAVEPASPAVPAVIPDLPADARVLLFVGPFLAHRGAREAVWSLDILHYLFPDLHLILVGSGPEEAETRRFAKLIGAQDHCHFIGPVSDLGPYFARADLVWIPGRAGGIHTMLEAMAAGKPVVAMRQAQRAEILQDEVTGLLAQLGDKADFCRQTRVVLEHPDRAAALGQAAIQAVQTQFGIDRFIEQMVKLYQGAATA